MTEDYAGRAKHSEDAGLYVRLHSLMGSGFDVDAQITAEPGITVLFGASGAGKTTVMDCIAGIRRPTSGRISIGERVLFDSETDDYVPVRERRIGYVFQTLALFPHMTAAKNIEYGLAKLPERERRVRVEATSASFGIAHVLGRKPHQLSGGERQRVALARTLVTDPVALLLDEPMSGLDLPTKSRIMDDLRRWNHSRRIPILYITHDRGEVFALAERVIVLDRGRVVAHGDAFDVMGTPRTERVAYLAGVENIFDAEVEAVHEERGTMTCKVGQLRLETPIVRVDRGASVRVGIAAGDILIATERPQRISARNIFPGRIVSLSRRDMMTVVEVNSGPVFEVHLTPEAEGSLGLAPGVEVWLVLKTHSCHLLWP